MRVILVTRNLLLSEEISSCHRKLIAVRTIYFFGVKLALLTCDIVGLPPKISHEPINFVIFKMFQIYEAFILYILTS